MVDSPSVYVDGKIPTDLFPDCDCGGFVLDTLLWVAREAVRRCGGCGGEGSR